jgi:uncharacterized phage-associated protein
MSDVGQDPRSVANGMIGYALARDMPVGNLSLQKLLYFAHASYLVRHNKPLVAGVFEAWEFGPVCRPIYDALKHYGRAPISSFIQRVDPFTGELSEIPEPPDIGIRDHIAGVMRSMGTMAPHQLVSLSHVAEGAWSVIWNKSKTGATVGNRIPDSLTVERFGRLKLSLKRESHVGGGIEAAPFAGD